MADADEFKNLINKRSTIKGRLTKFKTNLDVLNTLEIISQIEINKLSLKLSRFEALFKDFDVVQSRIEILNCEKVDVELATRELIEQDFDHCIAFARVLIERHTPNSTENLNSSNCSHNCSNGNIPSGSYRLPELKIPIFSGNFSKWLEFKEMFSSLVHNNEHIQKVHKFHYLTSYLDGEAAEVISNFDICADNYDEAWALLCERYDNKR